MSPNMLPGPPLSANAFWGKFERGEVTASKARSDIIGIFGNESLTSSVMQSF
jgi:hypothetical protein